ncbi:hypothetical protein [Bradyrhizobium sp. USDA 4508]
MGSRVKLLQSDSQAPRKLTAQQQKVADQSRQMRRYHSWRSGRFELMARGGSGEQWRELRSILRGMAFEEVQYLPEYVERQTWLLEADQETRVVALSLINDAIIKIRIRNGYAPINDSLPGEPPTVFERIRDILEPERREPCSAS